MIEETRETTTLIEIREFLERAGCAPEPWATPGSAVERLYETLRRRTADERFWSDLRQLASRLDDRRFAPPRIRGSQVLGPWVTEELLRELRASLPPVNGAPHPLAEWVRTRVSAAALAGFLLLGAATACTEGDGDVLCRDSAGEHGLEGGEATVYNALADMVDGADLSHDEKCTLYECLPEFDADQREALLESFQTLSEEELGWQLEVLLDICGDEDDDDDDDCDDNCH